MTRAHDPGQAARPVQTASGGLASPAVITALHTADFFPVLLRELSGVVAFSGVFVTRLYADRKPAHVYDTVRAARRSVVVDQYLDSAYLLDPFYDAFVNGRVNTVFRLRDVSPDHFRRSTYFRHYYGNIRLADEMAILIAMPQDSALFFSLGRLRGERAFSQRDLARCRAVLGQMGALTRKHFEHALGKGPAQELGLTLSSALDAFGAGVLTAREQQIAAMVLQGHSSGSISRRTGITLETVKSHRKNLYRKLEISSQSELLSRFLASVMG